MGENIQYYRFIIQLSEKFPFTNITYFCRKNVSHLFRKYNNIHIRDDSYPLQLNDYQYKMYIMSLPYYLGIETITQNTINYIQYDNTRFLSWNTKRHNSKYKATVEKVNENGTYDIVYNDDGKKEKEVKSTYMTSLQEKHRSAVKKSRKKVITKPLKMSLRNKRK